MIGEASEDESDGVLRVIESALLEIEPAEVREAIARGDVLIASMDDHIRGALVLDGIHIETIVVTRTHRAKGIGSTLVGAAAERGPLTAEFRPDVRPFYESLGFEIECDGERCRGRLAAQE